MQPLQIFIALSFASLLFSGCNLLDQKKQEEEQRSMSLISEEDSEALRSVEESEDIDLFLERLRKAVAARDMDHLASMMTRNFGYNLDPIQEGAGVFEYWEENNLWKELEMVLDEEFVPLGQFMVAPKEFADPSVNYTGYRAGLLKVGQKWKFAYFVNG